MKNKINIDDIVQLTETHKWRGALVQVTEIKSFGIQGFIFMPGYGDAFIRAKHDEFEVVGRAIITRER